MAEWEKGNAGQGLSGSRPVHLPDLTMLMPLTEQGWKSGKELQGRCTAHLGAGEVGLQLHVTMLHAFCSTAPKSLREMQAPVQGAKKLRPSACNAEKGGSVLDLARGSGRTKAI